MRPGRVVSQQGLGRVVGNGGSSDAASHTLEMDAGSRWNVSAFDPMPGRRADGGGDLGGRSVPHVGWRRKLGAVQSGRSRRLSSGQVSGSRAVRTQNAGTSSASGNVVPAESLRRVQGQADGQT